MKYIALLIVLAFPSLTCAFDLSVRSNDGSLTSLTATSTNSVLDLKTLIQGSSLAIDINNQRLVYQGQTLLDHNKLHNYQINEGSIVDLVEEPGAINSRILQDGEIISADIFNEIFTDIALANAPVSYPDLIGTWSARQVTLINGTTDGEGLTPGNEYGVSNRCGNYYDWGPEWTFDNNGFTQSRTDTVTFTAESGGGYLKFCFSNYDFFLYASSIYDDLDRSDPANDGCGYITTVGHKALTQTNGSTNYRRFTVEKTRTSPETIYISKGACNQTILTRIITKPNAPSSLNITKYRLTNTLTWTDNANNEDGFIILRKVKRGEWSSVATISQPDTSSYIDTVPSIGTYLYRVLSVKSGEQSDGSNVVKIYNHTLF